MTNSNLLTMSAERLVQLRTGYSLHILRDREFLHEIDAQIAAHAETKSQLEELKRDYESDQEFKCIKEQLAETRERLRELEASKEGWVHSIRNAERELADTREQLTGALENAASIAVKLGVDCDNMTPGEEWHASVKAIEQLRGQLAETRKIADELAEVLKPIAENKGIAEISWKYAIAARAVLAKSLVTNILPLPSDKVKKQ